jgi:hypothetical protein
MFFNLLGDLGGVKELIVLIFGIFLLPISEHSFILKAAKFLFIARTSNTNLFMKVDKTVRIKKFENSGLLVKSEISELQKHNKIHLGKK